MKVKQISIFLENRAGRLDGVARLLGEANVNIRALSLAETSDFGVLRLIVDKPAKASDTLDKNNFTYSFTDVVAVEIPDEPGGLAGILDVLTENGINVEYMYAFLEKATDKAVVVFRFDEIKKALTALDSNQINVLDGKEIVEL
jgi:hypothetical protein